MRRSTDQLEALIQRADTAARAYRRAAEYERDGLRKQEHRARAADRLRLSCELVMALREAERDAHPAPLPRSHTWSWWKKLRLWVDAGCAGRLHHAARGRDQALLQAYTQWAEREDDRAVRRVLRRHLDELCGRTPAMPRRHKWVSNHSSRAFEGTPSA